MGGAPVIEWIRDGVGFTPSAAASFRRAEASWRAKTGRQHIDSNSTYRDYDQQMSMHLAWNAYVGGYGPYPGHSRAIHPDYSIHCRGEALDSDDWTVPGFIAHMEDHGWIRTAASDPTERHHFEYQWWRDNHRNDPTPAGDGSSFLEADLDATQALQLSRVHDALVNTQGMFYYKPDATINILRGEHQPRLDGIVARTDAANHRLDAVLEMLRVLDPTKTADLDAFTARLRESEARIEEELRASEARSVAAVTKAIEDASGALRAEIVTGLSDAFQVPAGQVEVAIDAAFGRVFTNYSAGDA